jgi:hypothetical protein
MKQFGIFYWKPPAWKEAHPAVATIAAHGWAAVF